MDEALVYGTYSMTTWVILIKHCIYAADQAVTA